LQVLGLRFLIFSQGSLSFSANVVDAATLGVLAVDYLSSIFDTLSQDRLRIFFGISVVALAGFLNIRSMQLLEKASIVFAVLSLIPVVSIVIFSIPSLAPAVWLRRRPLNKVHLGRLLSLVVWNNSGYEMAGACAGEVKDPSAVLPRALGIAVILSTCCYVLPLAFAVCLPAGQDDTKWTDDYLSTTIASSLGGITFKVIACIFSAVSAVGMVCNTILASSRELQFMGLCGMVPTFFGETHPTYGTPHWSVLGICGVTAITIFAPFDPLVEFANYCTCVCYIVEFGGFLTLRHHEADRERPFQVGKSFGSALAMSLIPVAICVVSMVYSSKLTIVITTIFLGVLLLYYDMYAVQRITVPTDYAKLDTDHHGDPATCSEGL